MSDWPQPPAARCDAIVASLLLAFGSAETSSLDGPEMTAPPGQPGLLPVASDRRRPAIQVRGLRKRYEDVDAVRGISFEVDQGEIFGLIGPDGAGRPPRSRSWPA